MTQANSETKRNLFKSPANYQTSSSRVKVRTIITLPVSSSTNCSSIKRRNQLLSWDSRHRTLCFVSVLIYGMCPCIMYVSLYLCICICPLRQLLASSMRSVSLPALWQAITVTCICVFVCCILSLFFTSVAACGTTTTELLRWVLPALWRPEPRPAPPVSGVQVARTRNPRCFFKSAFPPDNINTLSRQHQYIINRAMHLRCIGEILMFINKAPWCFTGVPILSTFSLHKGESESEVGAYGWGWEM